MGDLAAENAALREIVRDFHWMARRYVDHRSSYATSLFNGHTRHLLDLGLDLNPTADGTVWARDSMGRQFDGLTDAIVRELAERGPFLVDDHASPFVECRLCAPTRRWSKYDGGEAFKPSNPANHAPSCLWRLACRVVAEITDRAVLPSDVAARREG